jgi:ABC-type nitrate/sulfonate/bicarbonate transport system substrate-binding protein
MLVNEKYLGLERKYGTKLELVTLPWEDILPAIGSAGETVDIGFVSLADYLIKANKLNSEGADPILFVYPAYVFKGGGFITFNPEVPEINSRTVNNPEVVKKFLSLKLGAQHNSCGQMTLFALAHNVGVDPKQLRITDTTMNDSILATENGSLDAAFAGLTQRTEALKRHGRIVLAMGTLGIADITGFACKESVYTKRKKDIDSLIRIWFDCVDYMLSDLDHHSAATLAYLKENASTQYTLAEYKKAIAYEYFPRSVAEEKQEIISDTGKFSINRITGCINQYLIDRGVAKSSLTTPRIVELEPQLTTKAP